MSKPTQIDLLKNKIDLLKEYFETKAQGQPLTVFDGLHIVKYMQYLAQEVKRTQDMLDMHIEVTKTY